MRWVTRSKNRISGPAANDWLFIDGVLTSLGTKTQGWLQHAWSSIELPGDPKLAPISADAGKAYLASVAQRFRELENLAIDLVQNNPASSAGYDAGEEIGRTVVLGAKKASALARELGSDLADTFDKTADRLEAGGLTIAKTFGAGLALAVIFALIYFGRKSG